MADYLIIGCSVAGVAAAEAIRKTDKTGSIRILTDEDRPAYGRPLISYELQGVTSDMSYRSAGFYESNNIELSLNTRAEKIDPSGHTVTTKNGETIPYKKLLVATGSSPFVPPAEGLDKVKNRFCFYTARDEENLKAALGSDSRLLIVGAGLIGLKCMEGAYSITKNITVLDLAPKVLSSVLDDECAALVREKIEEKGIRVILSDCVESYDAHSCVTRGGLKLDFDVLVTAVGVRPNVSLVEGAGGRINRGIVVDEGGRTTLPDVFAAGDCTVSRDVASGAEKVMAVLPNAYMQGEIAGCNMAGGDRTFPPLTPLNSIGFFGVHVLSAGDNKGEIVEKRGDGYLKRFFIRNGLLVGFMLVNSYDRAGILLSLIRERTPLSEVDFEAMIDEPRLAGLRKEVRTAKLDM